MAEAPVPEEIDSYDAKLTKAAGRYLKLRQLRSEAAAVSEDKTIHESVRLIHFVEASLLRVAELVTAYNFSGSLAAREVAMITPSISNFDHFLPSIAESVTASQE